MDINEAWKKLNEEKFSSTIKKEAIMEAITQESSGTISKLKKGLQYKLYWMYFFIALFIGGIVMNLDNLSYLILSAILLIIYALGAVGLYGQIENIDDQIDTSNNVLSEMKKHRDIVKQAIKNETRWGLVVFPFIILVMFLMPPLTKGIPLIEIISGRQFLISAAIGLFIIFPLFHWLGRKMNEHAYGKFLNQLEENIEKMEELS